MTKRKPEISQMLQKVILRQINTKDLLTEELKEHLEKIAKHAFFERTNTTVL